MILFMALLTGAGAIAGSPDQGKAEASIDKVYAILDQGSPIDAVADD